MKTVLISFLISLCSLAPEVVQNEPELMCRVETYYMTTCGNIVYILSEYPCDSNNENDQLADQLEEEEDTLGGCNP